MSDRQEMTAIEAAKYLGVSHDTISRLVAQQLIQGYKLTPKRNSRLRIYRDSVEEFDRQRKSQPSGSK